MIKVTASNNWTEIRGEERAVANIARNYYTDGSFALNHTTAGWLNLFTDALFLSPDQKTAQLVAQRVPNVYNYVLTFADRFSMARLLGAKDNTWAPVHADDLGQTVRELADVGGRFVRGRFVKCIPNRLFCTF
jgi:hypothetical protein